MLPGSALMFVHSLQAAMTAGVLVDWVVSFRNVFRKVRLGTAYGGWTIPRDAVTADSICYCVGCGEDISFDLELIRRYSCRVYGFDPTPRSIAYVRGLTQGIGKYTFSEYGVWDKTDTVRFYAPRDSEHVSHSITNLQSTDSYIEVRTKRLQDILRDFGHKHLALLKLDIEGAETAVIQTILDDKLAVDTLLVEFDELAFPSRGRLARIRASIRALFRDGYDLFSVAGSNFTFVRAPDGRAPD
jgi:FkbM family methyltransferase